MLQTTLIALKNVFGTIFLYHQTFLSPDYFLQFPLYWKNSVTALKRDPKMKAVKIGKWIITWKKNTFY